MGGHNINGLGNKVEQSQNPGKGKRIVIVGQNADVQRTLLRACLTYVGMEVTYEDKGLSDGLNSFLERFSATRHTEFPAMSKALLEMAALIHTMETSVFTLLDEGLWIVSGDDISCALVNFTENQDLGVNETSILKDMRSLHTFAREPDALIYLDEPNAIENIDMSEHASSLVHFQPRTLRLYSKHSAKETFKAVFMTLVAQGVIKIENPQEEFKKFIDFAKSSVQVGNDTLGALVKDLESNDLF